MGLVEPAKGYTVRDLVIRHARQVNSRSRLHYIIFLVAISGSTHLLRTSNAYDVLCLLLSVGNSQDCSNTAVVEGIQLLYVFSAESSTQSHTQDRQDLRLADIPLVSNCRFLSWKAGFFNSPKGFDACVPPPLHHLPSTATTEPR